MCQQPEAIALAVTGFATSQRPVADLVIRPPVWPKRAGLQPPRSTSLLCTSHCSSGQCWCDCRSSLNQRTWLPPTPACRRFCWEPTKLSLADDWNHFRQPGGNSYVANCGYGEFTATAGVVTSPSIHGADGYGGWDGVPASSALPTRPLPAPPACSGTMSTPTTATLMSTMSLAHLARFDQHRRRHWPDPDVLGKPECQHIRCEPHRTGLRFQSLVAPQLLLPTRRT